MFALMLVLMLWVLYGMLINLAQGFGIMKITPNTKKSVYTGFIIDGIFFGFLLYAILNWI